MRGTLLIILALLVLLALPASLSKSLPKANEQNNTTSGVAFGYPVTGTGGFQVAPSALIHGYAFGNALNFEQAIWPLALLPPFQVLFRGPTPVNV